MSSSRKKVEQTAYTVENVLLPPCENNIQVTSDPFIIWSPNSYQPDNYYCVRGANYFRGTGQGWVTAEYGMLPRATHTRGEREAARGKQSGRTQEIQRLIGRSLRAVVDAPPWARCRSRWTATC